MHVWQLNQQRLVGTLHVILHTGTDFMKVRRVIATDSKGSSVTCACHDVLYSIQVSDAMKMILHQHGIHATTIQPEYVGAEVGHPSRVCL